MIRIRWRLILLIGILAALFVVSAIQGRACPELVLSKACPELVLSGACPEPPSDGSRGAR